MKVLVHMPKCNTLASFKTQLIIESIKSLSVDEDAKKKLWKGCLEYSRAQVKDDA